MGCDLNVAEAEISDGEGSVFGVSYLLNPESGAVVALVDLGKDEYVSAFEVASWERRLDIVIPKPPSAAANTP